MRKKSIMGAVRQLNSRPSQPGGVGYDNSRENIDPRIVTKSVLTKEISGTSLHVSPLYVDGTNVGIGTASPGSKLTVNGDIGLLGSSPNIRTATADASLTIGTFTGALASLTLKGADHVSLQTYGGGAFNDRLYIQSDGNVGINTSTPDRKLHVSGGTLALSNYTTATPKLSHSGQLVVSGGNLYYIGTSGTMTTLAVA